MANLRKSGVFNLGGLSGDNAFEEPSLELNFDGQLSSFTRATTNPTAAKANGDQLATEIVSQNKSGSVQSKYMGPHGKLISGYVNNLVPHSTDFSTSAGWTHSGSPSLTTGQADPFGGTNATTIGDTNNAGYSLIEYTASLSDDLALTASIFIKKQSQTNTDQVCLFRLRTGGSGTGLFDLQIKPQDGSYNLVDWVGVQPANLEATREDFGDWWRFSITAGNPNITTINYLYQFFPDVGTSFANPGGNYVSTGTGAVTIFGAQFEVAGSPSQYVPSTASPAQVARVEYDASGNPLGLLVEEARTNTVPNTEMLAYTGSYTSLRMANTGHTVTTNAETAPDGTSSATLIAPGNSNAYYAGHAQNYTAGTTYTFSTYVKVPSGSTFDGQVGFLLYGADFNSGGGNINAYWNLETDGTASFSSSANNPEDYGIIDAGNGWYRIWVTETCTNSVTSKVQQHFRVKGLSATNYATDTLLQWGAQIEVGAGPTSLIAANSTRTDDDITLATSAFGFDKEYGTAFVDATVASKSSSSYPGIYDLSATGFKRNLFAYIDISLANLYWQFSETNFTNNLIASGVTYPLDITAAQRRDDTTGGGALDGTLASSISIDTATTAPTLLSLGRQSNDSMNGHIRRFTYWPRAISDASLVAYTGANPPTELVARSTRRWGGMLGRSVVSGGNVEATGVLSLAEHYQSKL